MFFQRLHLAQSAILLTINQANRSSGWQMTILFVDSSYAKRISQKTQTKPTNSPKLFSTHFVNSWAMQAKKKKQQTILNGTFNATYDEQRVHRVLCAVCTFKANSINTLKRNSLMRAQAFGIWLLTGWLARWAAQHWKTIHYYFVCNQKACRSCGQVNKHWLAWVKENTIKMTTMTSLHLEKQNETCASALARTIQQFQHKPIDTVLDCPFATCANARCPVHFIDRLSILNKFYGFGRATLQHLPQIPWCQIFQQFFRFCFFFLSTQSISRARYFFFFVPFSFFLSIEEMSSTGFLPV